MAGTGIGSTITFSGDFNITASIQSIGQAAEFVDVLDDTGLATQNYRSSCPDDLAQLESLDVNVFWNGARPAVGAEATATLTFAEATLANGATITGKAFVERVQYPNLASGELMVATVTLKFTGESYAFGPAT